MELNDNRSILGRYPVSGLIIVSIVSIVLGLALVMSVVGSIAGIPLLFLGIVTGIAAWWKMRKAGEATVDEVEGRGKPSRL